MLRWTPAAHSDVPFTVAEVSAFSPSRGNLLASNRDFSTARTTSDSKDVADSMHVLIATGKYSRFAESDDLLVDKQDGSYVYLVTNEQAVRNGFLR